MALFLNPDADPARFFQGRELLVATRHRKEQVLAPLLEQALKVLPRVSENFDSDAFGTFSGEVERPSDPLSTLRQKCLKAMELYGYDLVVGSEGSFGPHPSLPFLAAGEEWLLLLDKRNAMEIIVREISTETNFRSGIIPDEEALMEFTLKVRFPSHAVILRSGTDIRKGIQTESQLLSDFRELHSCGLQVQAETDMRACYNPTRMQQIESLAHKLIEKIKCTCPNCHWPGLEVLEAEEGLPCADCGAPTRQLRLLHYGCKNCGYRQPQSPPGSANYADPACCMFCNP